MLLLSSVYDIRVFN